MTAEIIKQALDRVAIQTALNMEYFEDTFPSASTLQNQYQKVKNEDWVEGFWTGILWMMFEYQQQPVYREMAQRHVISFIDRMDRNIVLDHHDMGFLYSLSCVASYRLTGDEAAKEVALRAADKLIARWHENPGFIQAWGAKNDPQEHRFIIDSLLNLPLLYWANEETGISEYRDIADRHYQICLTYLIRDNGSSYHTYYVDPITHIPSHGLTRQGFSDDSSWARGQAWSIYGIALGYKHYPLTETMSQFMAVTDYFLEKLPENQVAYWDLIFNDGSDQPRDSSAAAIAVCGMLEMLPHITDSDYRKKTESAVDAIMLSLIKNYANKKPEKGHALLNEGVYSWHDNFGIEEGNIWGDYFYVEALMRLNNPSWKPYW
ncbi:glycoside hydrolase family 88 protein [Erysipelothrix anatis]|uniref:glycoside hydrolase family 88 protein n=1 Tax=Erysipelothrix anatis TaxID=2683713 RepID=UPI00135A9CBE|nr:glycoside hydrolase family 88 protein [Erysipelothrix anatis]